MLVLSRKLNEKIFVGENQELVITIVKIRGDKVRLGLDAPKGIPIHREEVWAEIKRDERQAS